MCASPPPVVAIGALRPRHDAVAAKNSLPRASPSINAPALRNVSQQKDMSRNGKPRRVRVYNLVKLSTPAIKIDVKSPVVSDVFTNSTQLPCHRRNQPGIPHDLQVQYYLINTLVTEPGRPTFS